MLTQELLPDVRLQGSELETPAPVAADNEVDELLHRWQTPSNRIIEVISV